ncbi:MAG: hypothetical protein WB565_00135 [Acidimicrobiales bacterium]
MPRRWGSRIGRTSSARRRRRLLAIRAQYERDALALNWNHFTRRKRSRHRPGRLL